MELYPSMELYPYTVSLLLFDKLPSVSKTWPMRLQSNRVVVVTVTTETNWVVVVVFVD